MSLTLEAFDEALFQVFGVGWVMIIVVNGRLYDRKVKRFLRIFKVEAFKTSQLKCNTFLFWIDKLYIHVFFLSMHDNRVYEKIYSIPRGHQLALIEK